MLSKSSSSPWSASASTMTCKKEIRICYASSHIFVSTTSLVSFEYFFYLVGGWSKPPWPLPKPSQGTPPPEYPICSPRPAEKNDTKVFMLKVVASHLQACWLAVISPVLQVCPLVKKRVSISEKLSIIFGVFWILFWTKFIFPAKRSTFAYSMSYIFWKLLIWRFNWAIRKHFWASYEASHFC